jgi:NitT/TauT family transport system permease protein
MTGRARTWVVSTLAANQAAIAVGIALLVLWEAFAQVFAFSLNIIPPPSWIVWSLHARFDLLMEHAWLTFHETIVGFLVSVVVGIAIGWIVSKSRLLYDALYPLIAMLQVVPKEALAPLLVLWFGAGSLSRTILAFLIAFFPMVINTILGVRGIESNARRYATSLSCNSWQIFLKVELPWSLPSIFAGMKISVTLAVVGVVVAEIVAGQSGLGYLLLFASSRRDMGFSLAILAILALWGGALFGMVALLERRAVFWRR